MPATRTRDCRPSRRPIQPSRAAAGRLPGASGAGHPAAAPETVPADGDGPRDASRAALSAGPRAAPLRPPRWPPADGRGREPAAQPPLGRRQLRRPRRGPTSRRPLPQRAGAVASVPRPVVPAHRRRTSVPPSDSSRPPLCLWCGCAASSAARLRPARALASQRCGSESASAAAAAAASAAAAAVEAPRAAAKQNTKKKDRRRGRQKGLRRAPRPLASRAPSAPPARPHISCSASGGGGRGPAARRQAQVAVCSLRRRRGETSAVRTAQRREGECRERDAARDPNREEEHCVRDRGTGMSDVRTRGGSCW